MNKRNIILSPNGKVKWGKGHPIGKFMAFNGGYGAVILTPENAYKGWLFPELSTRVFASSRAELRAKIAEIYANN